MQYRLQPTINDGLVVEYKDTFKRGFSPKYYIRVARKGIVVEHAEMYSKKDVAIFNHVMKAAILQHNHLQLAQTHLEHTDGHVLTA